MIRYEKKRQEDSKLCKRKLNKHLKRKNRAMPSTHGGHCPFPYAVIISVLNLLHHSCTVLEANLVGSSHLNHIFLVFLTRLIVRSNSPLSSHSARKNCSSIGTVQE